MFAGTSITAQTLTTITSNDDLMMFGGHMPLSISPNGKYVVGSTAALMMFTYDVEKQESIVFTEEQGSAYDMMGAELRGVNDNGEAVGFDDNGGVQVDMNGGYQLVEPFSEEANIILCERITEDGSIIVGSVSDDSWMQKACYWENGEKHFLPAPTTEEMGFEVNGSAAKFVSADGSIIVGWAVDDFAMYPMVIWERQADGTYVLNPASKGKYETLHEPIYDENWNIAGWECGPNPYLQYTPAGISADGKTIVMQIVENTETGYPPVKIGLYDVETGELEVIGADGNHGIEEGASLTVAAIANDGTVVGYTGSGYYDPIKAFVMYKEEKQPRLVTEVFADVEGMDAYAEFADMGGTFMATSISSDGRYIIGYGEYMDWETFMFGYKGFIIDTNGTATSVNAAKTETNGQAEYYTIDGRKVDTLGKGLNIVKTANGETKKVVVK